MVSRGASMNALGFILDAYRLASGQLRGFTMVGGYPILYLDGENSVLCAHCAGCNPGDICAAGINWESELRCDECSAEIECAYPAEETCE